MTGNREFLWPVRVYWEDTDSAGVVYYANYLKFMERARTEWLRALGVEQEILRDQDERMFVVRRVETDYRQPARYGEELQVVSRIAERTPARLVFRQQVCLAASGVLLVEGMVEVVCVNALTFRPARMPGWLQQLLDR